MILAAACALAALALAAVCAARGGGGLRGHRPGCLPRAVATRAAGTLLRVLIAILTAVRAVRAAAARVRRAWRGRGRPPVPGGGEKLTRAESRVPGSLAAGRDVRSRT